MYYKVIIPKTSKMGSHCFNILENSISDGKELSALYWYNRARELAKRKPAKRLPKGTKFLSIEKPLHFHQFS